MSTDSLNGIVGQPAHFAGDYLFRQQALPNTTTIYSEDYTFNNTLGKLKLVGEIHAPLTMAVGNTLSIMIQYQDDTVWKNLSTLLSLSGANTLEAGEIFACVPVPNESKRKFRLSVTTNFDASDVAITAAVEILARV